MSDFDYHYFLNLMLPLITNVVNAVTLATTGSIIYYFVYKMSRKYINSLEIPPRKKTVLFVAIYFMQVIIIFQTILYVLEVFGMSEIIVIIISSVGSIAISFGVREIVADIVKGNTLIIDQKMHVGDIVVINEISGAIESFGIRNMRIRNGEGSIVIIPNGSIGIVTNKTTNKRKAVVQFSVANFASIDKLLSWMEIALLQFKNEYKLEHVPSFDGILSIAKDGMTIQLTAIVPFDKIAETEKELNNYLVRYFIEKQDELTYPITEIIMKEM